MRALVCDDEPLVRSELSYTLRRLRPDAHVVEVGDAVTALEQIAASRFDVIFLDIEMHGLSGIDALRIIEKSKDAPRVVLVSAHDEHAISAFEHAALDYLVKPVSEARLSRTLDRLTLTNEAPDAATDKLPVYHGEKTRFVRIGDIRFVEADRRGVNVVTFDGVARFRGTLAECALRLERHGFLRVHRAFLVNVQHVLEITPSFGGTYVLRFDDRGRRDVPVSRNYARSVRERLGL
jgi:two-component system, LytTR family, response regulator LytT